MITKIKTSQKNLEKIINEKKDSELSMAYLKFKTELDQWLEGINNRMLSMMGKK